ncbi:MAG TPA: hypothetical protein VFH10_07380 [Nocardioides sp.]|uniref:hypothetical protein n=1 Tax=Nocardioides sp. TaxID=35761 RepID=UPI002D810C73|nr:hypothetical protein [Nocardioides sp.]HET6652444.1 hypothetical protein [Nocardioides sp.]
MAVTEPVNRHDHQRLTVVAAAVSVLLVLGLPPLVGHLLSLVPPVDPPDRFPLTERAKRVAELPGASILQDRVILFLTPDMHAPVFRPSQRVDPRESAGQLVPLGVSGLLPMNPYLAPYAAAGIADGLWPGDKVYTNLGALVVGCLPRYDDPRGECTPTLLTRQPNAYFAYPRSWGTSTFLEPGTAMQAQIYEVLGGNVVIGGRPGTDTDRVVVRLANGSTVTAFTTESASPGDTVWWAAVTREAIEATAYDARGNELETVDLNGSQL